MEPPLRKKSPSIAWIDRLTLTALEAVFLSPAVFLLLLQSTMVKTGSPVTRLALAPAVFLAIYGVLYRFVTSVPAHALICLASLFSLYALSF